MDKKPELFTAGKSQFVSLRDSYLRNLRKNIKNDLRPLLNNGYYYFH